MSDTLQLIANDVARIASESFGSYFHDSTYSINNNLRSGQGIRVVVNLGFFYKYRTCFSLDALQDYKAGNVIKSFFTLEYYLEDELDRLRKEYKSLVDNGKNFCEIHHNRWIKFNTKNNESKNGIVVHFNNPDTGTPTLLILERHPDIEDEFRVCDIDIENEIVYWEYYIPTVEELIAKLKPTK